MSEEQERPKRKWYKGRSTIPLLAFIAIICALVFLVVTKIVSTGSGTDVGRQAPYNTAREQMQNAVTAYGAWHNGSLPILNGTYTNANCSNCSVINISTLLTTNGGMMRMAPDGLNLSARGNDNCGGNASLGCKKGSHYIWIVDANGDVYSTCVGKDCASNNSGYQGVWP